jgi:hypothetical protein
MDVVDRYLQALLLGLENTCGLGPAPPPAWPGGAAYGVVLSHDVDFLSVHQGEAWAQAARTLARHLLRQRDLGAGACGLGAFLTGQIRGRDVFCPLDEIMRRERAMGVSSSFQVAVARSHPSDVNYDVRDPRVLDRLRSIVDAGFDLAIHGSLASNSSLEAYAGEVKILAEQLGPPLGSRQHFLSFDPDVLVLAQERSGIEYDMSLGFPDHTGSRAGFSFPFYPFCVAEDRHYDVVQIGLVIMDVTLRTYMALSNQQAREEVDVTLEGLRRRGGCASVVWHPIVFGGARDPGMDDVFWHLVERVLETGGLATDGATINNYWRSRGHAYESFRHLRGASSRASGCPQSDEANATAACTPAVAAPLHRPERVQEDRKWPPS